MRVRLLLILLCALLPACGWQLQGARRMPDSLQPLYVEWVDVHSEFARALQQQLTMSGVVLTDDRQKARVQLVIVSDATGHHVSSVSALNEPQQYEVYYNLSYRFEQNDEQRTALLPLQTVDLSRTMSYDKTLALAKQREEVQLRQQLAEDQATQLLRRLMLSSQRLDQRSSQNSNQGSNQSTQVP